MPGPGEYKVSPKWGVTSKTPFPTKKNTYIDKIIFEGKERPIPSAA